MADNKQKMFFSGGFLAESDTWQIICNNIAKGRFSMIIGNKLFKTYKRSHKLETGQVHEGSFYLYESIYLAYCIMNQPASMRY